jgi:hypothetical protein
MSIISKIITKLAYKQIEEAKIQARTNGYQEGIRKYWNDKEQRLEHEYNTRAVGKKIIYCSNEWEDPHFGIIVGTAKVTAGDCLMVKSRDVLTGQIHLIHPESFYYTDELMTLAILKLNPFERWNMSIGKLSHMHLMWNKRYQKSHITSSRELEFKLRKCGFLFKDHSVSLWLDSKFNTKLSKWNENVHLYHYKVVNGNEIKVILDDVNAYTLILDNQDEVEKFKSIVSNGDNWKD